MEPGSGRLRILLIEDDISYGALATALLEAGGCSVVLVHRAEEGLRLALEQPPDLIVMDTNLPGMSGFEAIEQLRREPRTSQIPVIGMTAGMLDGDGERSRARAAGFDGYIEKPVHSATFFEAIQPVLRRPGPVS